MSPVRQGIKRGSSQCTGWHLGNAIASRVKLKLEWRMGPASFDWDVIAKKEHLDEIDAYMQRFTRTIKALNDELKEIRITENKMREITGTNKQNLLTYSLSRERRCCLL